MHSGFLDIEPSQDSSLTAPTRFLRRDLQTVNGDHRSGIRISGFCFSCAWDGYSVFETKVMAKVPPSCRFTFKCQRSSVVEQLPCKHQVVSSSLTAGSMFQYDFLP